VVSDDYLIQSFDNYNRELHYQVRNQLPGDLTVSGLGVTESYALNSNSCNRHAIETASDTTNAQGRFKDNYWVNGSGNPGCAQNSNCTTNYTQEIRVAGILVRTNGVIYGCNGVSITPQ